MKIIYEDWGLNCSKKIMRLFDFVGKLWIVIFIILFVVGKKIKIVIKIKMKELKRVKGWRLKYFI